MIENQEFIQNEAGVRLDAALFSRYPTSSRAFCREACAEGSVLVDGRPAIKGLKLRGGETIRVVSLAEMSDNRVTPDRSVRVQPIFEDGALLAFDKPAGLPVQPLSRKEVGTLMNGVVVRYPECTELGDQPLMAGAIHRIDADTSGLVLVARTAEAFANLRGQFADQTVKKTYLALVEGSVAVGATLENDLIHDPTLPFCRMIDISRARQKVRAAPLHAVTQYRPLALTRCGNEERTLLEVTIYTGVTHQIRAQLAFAGLHIVNDRLYGAFAVENQTGHCLHALAAQFNHPLSGAPTEIRTRYPAWAASIVNC
ncbi:MAG: RluA family pseudouridine synthase [Kiritimatiellae bacterium]|nr:RluA family pseudouridine synthase [Kiritimatiellia bacterium]